MTWYCSLGAIALTVASLWGASTGVAQAIDDDNLLVPFAQALAAPKASLGKIANWGGTIAAVTTLAEGTRIEIQQYPLANDGGPDVDRERSGGRFYGYITGPVDQGEWQVGRWVTVRGEIAASEEGESEPLAVRPVLKIESFRFWRQHRHHDWDDDYDHHHDHDFYRDPFYDPRWHYHGSVIIVR